MFVRAMCFSLFYLKKVTNKQHIIQQDNDAILVLKLKGILLKIFISIIKEERVGFYCLLLNSMSLKRNTLGKQMSFVS